MAKVLDILATVGCNPLTYNGDSTFEEIYIQDFPIDRYDEIRSDLRNVKAIDEATREELPVKYIASSSYSNAGMVVQIPISSIGANFRILFEVYGKQTLFDDDAGVGYYWKAGDDMSIWQGDQTLTTNESGENIVKSDDGKLTFSIAEILNRSSVDLECRSVLFRGNLGSNFTIGENVMSDDVLESKWVGDEASSPSVCFKQDVSISKSDLYVNLGEHNYFDSIIFSNNSLYSFKIARQYLKDISDNYKMYYRFAISDNAHGEKLAKELTYTSGEEDFDCFMVAIKSEDSNACIHDILVLNTPLASNGTVFKIAYRINNWGATNKVFTKARTAINLQCNGTQLNEIKELCDSDPNGIGGHIIFLNWSNYLDKDLRWDGRSLKIWLVEGENKIELDHYTFNQQKTAISAIFIPNSHLDLHMEILAIVYGMDLHVAINDDIFEYVYDAKIANKVKYVKYLNELAESLPRNINIDGKGDEVILEDNKGNNVLFGWSSLQAAMSGVESAYICNSKALAYISPCDGNSISEEFSELFLLFDNKSTPQYNSGLVIYFNIYGDWAIEDDDLTACFKLEFLNYPTKSILSWISEDGTKTKILEEYFFISPNPGDAPNYDRKYMASRIFINSTKAVVHHDFTNNKQYYLATHNLASESGFKESYDIVVSGEGAYPKGVGLVTAAFSYPNYMLAVVDEDYTQEEVEIDRWVYSKIYKGDNQIKKIYSGENKVYDYDNKSDVAIERAVFEREEE
jgi:hypothetical protein